MQAQGQSFHPCRPHRSKEPQKGEEKMRQGKERRRGMTERRWAKRKGGREMVSGIDVSLEETPRFFSLGMMSPR